MSQQFKDVTEEKNQSINKLKMEEKQEQVKEQFCLKESTMQRKKKKKKSPQMHLCNREIKLDIFVQKRNGKT